MSHPTPARPRRSRGHSVLLAVAFPFLIAGSALAAVGGEPIGYAGLLLFGGGGAFLLWQSRADARRRQRAAAGPDLRHGTLAGADRYANAPAGVVCPARPWAALAAAGGSAIFVGVGVLMTFAALSGGLDPVWGLVIGLLSLVAGGSMLVPALPRLFGPPLGILLLPEGIYCRMPVGTAWLPWDTVGTIRMLTIHNQDSVAFTLGEGAGTPVITGPQRWYGGASRRMYAFDVAYPGSALAVPPEDVLALVVRLHGDPGLRAQLRDPSILETLRRPGPSAWRRW